MAPQSTKPTISPRLQRLVERTDEEAERRRKVYGDPEEALSSFVREHFDRAALEEALDAMLGGEGRCDDTLIGR